MGRPPKFGVENKLKQFTARLPPKVAEIVKQRQEAAGSASLNEQVVRDLATLYGIDLTAPEPDFVQEEMEIPAA